MVKIHDQRPEQLQEKHYDKKEKKIASFACFIFGYAWLKSYYVRGFFSRAQQPDLVSYYRTLKLVHVFQIFINLESCGLSYRKT